MKNIILKQAKIEDAKNILTWRNRPEIRTWMYNSNIITWEEHIGWITKILKDNSRHLIIMESNAFPVAIISINLLNNDPLSCEWGFYPTTYSERGISRLTEYVALKYMFEELKVQRVQCEVLSTNRGIINLHKKAGFQEEGILRKSRKTDRGIEAVHIFGMLEEEWTIHKDVLLRTLTRQGTIKINLN